MAQHLQQQMELNRQEQDKLRAMELALLQSQINQMDSGGNEKLVMASLSSLVDTEGSTTVSIPSKSLEVSYLTLTAYDASFWKICTIGMIPGAFLLIGFMIWLKRRKA